MSSVLTLSFTRCQTWFQEKVEIGESVDGNLVWQKSIYILEETPAGSRCSASLLI